ncbi:hypothetical protein ABK040_009063 [Willaertia magna]
MTKSRKKNAPTNLIVGEVGNNEESTVATTKESSLSPTNNNTINITTTATSTSSVPLSSEDQKKDNLLSVNPKLNIDRLTTPLKTSASLPFGLSESGSGFFNTDDEDVFQFEVSREIENEIIRDLKDKVRSHQQEIQQAVPLLFTDVLSCLKEGVEHIVKDDFTECFRPKPPEPWNNTIFLFFGWSLGVITRYTILFPLRFLFFLFGTLIFIFVTLFLMLLRHLMPSSDKKKDNKANNTNDKKAGKISTLDWLVRKSLQYYSSIWLHSMSAVIKVHGTPPVRRKNQIYVSNHTSLLDFILLTNLCGVATVGQHHTGFVGFMQDRVVSPLKNIWFERFESRDRKATSQRIQEHINDVSNPPLLIFPEGVCVNNEYCVLFKKGVFEIEDVEICPVALKYDKTYSDPYWSSKDESFLVHILRIMKSWCLVCDVYFLEPQKKLPNEDAIAFSNRVKELISRKAKLHNLSWDGYLKYYSPSEKLTEAKRRVNAEILKRRFLLGDEVEERVIMRRSTSTNSLREDREEESGTSPTSISNNNNAPKGTKSKQVRFKE